MLHLLFDCESLGLYGDVFAVGWVVVDDATGLTVEEGREAAPSRTAYAHAEADRRWVREHVPELPFTAATLPALRDAFWGVWERYRGRGVLLWADGGYPVEAGFLTQCVETAPSKRARLGPYPLHELATLRLAVGLDPTGTEPRLASELPAHDPLADARQSARLLLEALGRSVAQVDAYYATAPA